MRGSRPRGSRASTYWSRTITSPGARLPDANVIVNPNLPGSGFGSRALAGVGVAFYVMVALRRLLEQRGLLPSDALPVTDLLDLVALGTVADVVPFDLNNRILVAQGLARIRAGRCVPGISALLEVARRAPGELVSADLGFAVAPRLNAAGRLDRHVGRHPLPARRRPERCAQRWRSNSMP